MLEVENLAFDYGGIPILQDISFRAEPGELLALLGPNGTGKTTLLRAIGMLLPPKGGRCVLDGEDLSGLSPGKRARRVAYLPQDTGSPFPIRVMDAVLLGRTPYARFSPSREDRETAARLLERLDLLPLAMREVGSLSGGERQRVWLARALAQEPRLLLLDEPTSSLDLRNQLGTMGLIRDLCREEGLTAVAAIHDLNLAAEFCRRFLMLRQGSVFAWGGREVLMPENIRVVYGVEAEVLEHGGRRVILPRGLSPREEDGTAAT